jgi:uncharacterized protein (TIGR00255 family)
MLSSMTGFARSEGTQPDGTWVWEVRSVNARGLELRWRLPPGLEGLEPALRETVSAQLRRGSVQLTLSVRSEAGSLPAINEAALEQALQVALRFAARIPGAATPRIELLLALPGIMGGAKSGEASEFASPVPGPVMDAVRAGFGLALERLVAARQAEGARLAEVLRGFVRQLDELRFAAEEAAAAQPALHRDRLMASVATLLAAQPALPAERIAQEVALLASRSDVREELDRLKSHIQAATQLLDGGGPVGRQLDFLVQEFLREANTICSKSSTRDLTALGLQLKAVMEQVREQVQNLE